MKKSFGMMAAALLMLGCLGGCNGNKDPYERINGEIAISKKNFPDEIFRRYITEYRDEDKNGSLSDLEIQKVQSINVLGDTGKITSLKGIEVFYNLIKLSCIYNDLTELDLSKNTKLQTVNCSFNQLTSLNVSGCKELGALNCSRNQLKELNISGNPRLYNLICSKNQLKRLDLANNYLLEYLECIDNQLENLDLSHCDSSIRHYEDFGVEVDFTYKEADQGPNIDAINFPDEIFRNYVLSIVDQDGNGILSEKEMRFTRTISLDDGVTDLTGIHYFTDVMSLECMDGNLTELDLSSNQKLACLYCSNNKLSKLDLSNNRELVHLQCDGNQLKDLDCSDNPELIWLDCRNNPLDRLDIHNCSSDIELKLPTDRDVKVIEPQKRDDPRNTKVSDPYYGHPPIK